MFGQTLVFNSATRSLINQAYRQDEERCVEHLLAQIELTTIERSKIKQFATDLVTKIRAKQQEKSGIQAFMQQYDLSSEEGIALMCLAEALLRIPDNKTVNALIRDKIAMANWAKHQGKSHSLFVNVATWSLALTGQLLRPEQKNTQYWSSILKNILSNMSEPVIRGAVRQMMRVLGNYFVLGRTIQEAIKRGRNQELKHYRYSYDMLGEAARTAKDAMRYFQAYAEAIETLGKTRRVEDLYAGDSVSVKLSALYPRYEVSQHDQAVQVIGERLLALAQLAKQYNLGLTVDAEEADRLDISLDIFEKVYREPSLQDWSGLGLAVQAYQKRAWYVLDWLAELATQYQRKIMVRLVKGAYWDSEIKLTQELGLKDYPVFTRKFNTDVSYLACAQKLLKLRDRLYPQFATHNAHTVAAVLTMAGEDRAYEFQCLYGMGTILYDALLHDPDFEQPCRMYAPVGVHEDLLPYLVRRLLENGANSSFVNNLVNPAVSIEELTQDPIAKVESYPQKSHPKIPKPSEMYQGYRANSQGIDLSDYEELQTLEKGMQQAAAKNWEAMPLIAGKDSFAGRRTLVRDPSNRERIVGEVSAATKQTIELAVQAATEATERWQAVPVEERAACLEKAAKLFEDHHAELMYLAVREAGKTLSDSVAEVREAVDFCYYYAAQARKLFKPQSLPGPTGETNELYLQGRGPIVCISPWNFPLAIFTGQVVAALVAGNPVLAKPAEQTSLIAFRAVELLYQAGIPRDVLQLLPGEGPEVGAPLVADPRIKGVMFTGSTEIARFLNQTLANRPGPIIPLIAETGGQNAMLVDSTALPEQAVVDIMRSAFGSTGQRCSALRVLFVQEEIAEKLMTMLCGAMAELKVGDPGLLETDIGPVIDKPALDRLQQHEKKIEKIGKLIYQQELPTSCQQGTFFAPRAYEIASISQLEREVFGPILHIVRYSQNSLDKIIADINATGYGLTLGIHTRINEKAHYIQRRLRVGNTYINRNMIGAVVGVQPFGGEGLSGTGPKAGGPYYLPRLCVERCVTVNVTATGGNASLMMLGAD